MKNKNRENTDRRVVLVLALVLLTSLSCNHQNKGQTRADDSNTDTLVFEGTLEKLGPDPGFVSGILAVYRLAKYRVNKVCEGKYEGSEIVVDHTVFTLKEFDGVKVGDQVCVRVRISKKIHAQYSAEGIRDPSEVVKIFYIADGNIKAIDDAQVCCASQK